MTGIKSKITESAINERLISEPSDLDVVREHSFDKKAVEMAAFCERTWPDMASMSDLQITKIVRYFMLKAAETCIAHQMYSFDPNRTCTIYYLPDEVEEAHPTISIPQHFAWELDDLSMHYLMPVKEMVTSLRESGELKDGLIPTIRSFQEVAYANAYSRKSYRCQGQYDTLSIRTLDEVRMIALNGLHQTLPGGGWTIEKMNYRVDSPWSILATHNGERFAIIMRTNYERWKNPQSKDSMERLVEFAKKEDRSVGFLFVNIRSANKQHADGGVIIIGDQIAFSIRQFTLYGKTNNNQ